MPVLQPRLSLSAGQVHGGSTSHKSKEPAPGKKSAGDRSATGRAIPFSRSGKPGTATSRFGVSRREGHDASGFYARFQAPELSDDASIHVCPHVDRIICGDSTDMSAIPDRSVALVVTSPPYFVGKAYEEDLGKKHIPASYAEYLAMLHDVFAECRRVLEPGGRIAVNIANLGRKPYRSLSADVIRILQDDLQLLLRGEIIWQKAAGASGNCAWGSFGMATNPVIRDVSERVVIACKGRFDRAVSAKERATRGLPHESTISKEEFMALTLDVWQMPTESAKRIGHPAPFPVELPRRLIELYTFAGDLILDPFVGSGSTAVAAVRTGRHFVGYDIDPDYCSLAERRLSEEKPSEEPGEGGRSERQKRSNRAPSRSKKSGKNGPWT